MRDVWIWVWTVRLVLKPLQKSLQTCLASGLTLEKVPLLIGKSKRNRRGRRAVLGSSDHTMFVLMVTQSFKSKPVSI